MKSFVYQKNSVSTVFLLSCFLFQMLTFFPLKASTSVQHDEKFSTGAYMGISGILAGLLLPVISYALYELSSFPDASLGSQVSSPSTDKPASLQDPLHIVHSSLHSSVSIFQKWTFFHAYGEFTDVKLSCPQGYRLKNPDFDATGLHSSSPYTIEASKLDPQDTTGQTWEVQLTHASPLSGVLVGFAVCLSEKESPSSNTPQLKSNKANDEMKHSILSPPPIRNIASDITPQGITAKRAQWGAIEKPHSTQSVTNRINERDNGATRVADEFKLSAETCQYLRKKAVQTGCINEAESHSLEKIKAMAVCDNENNLRTWDYCR